MSNPEPLLYGTYYHIYNRGNNGENIFFEKRNYPYFLELYTKYIVPIADTYAYVLLRNHFHFGVRIKEKEEILQINRNLSGLPDLTGLSDKLPSQKFANFFNAYAKSINKSYNRSGALFERPFGRKMITGEAHFVHLIKYIHFNPQKHGFIDDFREWKHSSYEALCSSTPTKLNRKQVLWYFGGLEAFKKEHQNEVIDNDFVQRFVDEDVD
ncbi:MAG: hypothetical protein B6I38_08405 [Anaerolineaceae bacterium 4572_5.1]|nr:MAG: hypothetical protein B6I38_08405 [Anaerolineaceae bacterium 4572_5.1]